MSDVYSPRSPELHQPNHPSHQPWPQHSAPKANMANSVFNYSNGPPQPNPPPQQHQQGQVSNAPWFVENGRYYGTFHPGQYLMPIDENELDRMDIMHKFFTVARKHDALAGGLHEAKISSAGPRILDLGCGTGIWAIDMADAYQSGRVIGLDLNYSQPESIPATIEFRRQDIEEHSWGLEPDSFDMVHLQMLAGSIRDWPALYKNALRHLKPGIGVIEHVEIDFLPQSGDHSLPQDSRLRFWFSELRSAFERAGLPLSLEPAPESWLKQAGFEDIKRNIKEIPYHPWPSDEYQKEIGRWLNMGMLQGIEAMTMAPLTRYKGYSASQVRVLIEDVKREICTRSFRSHCTMYIYTARRPAARY